ncbi:MAG: non-hydrolyzing UDP-N-acetylglucosamine 2-epimerase [Longimicrobiales bacterium]
MAAPRILTVIGTRPEAIKMAPVIRALENRDDLEHRTVLTGQHSELVSQILQVFGIRADFDLALMSPGQTLYDIGRACLDGLRTVTEEYAPDVTVVQGDTASVFFSGLVTFFEKGRLAHVEAGLRSGEKWAPFPEEMLRRMTDTLSDFCFAPTRLAASNLKAEGVPQERLFITGNTVVDALETVAAAELPISDPTLAGLVEGEGPLVLLTAHRRESFGEPLGRIFAAVRELSVRHPDISVVYPVHPNPAVQGPAQAALAGQDRIHLVPPLSYSDLIWALKESALVLTDSGGIQEEAPTFGTPVLVLRDVTERPEGVQAGVAQLVGSDAEQILSAAGAALQTGTSEARRPNPYGDGAAGERIADILTSDLLGVPRALQDWTGA